MAIVREMNMSDFIHAFKSNEERKNQFSYDALQFLFEYIEAISDGSNRPWYFDMVAICCEWSEFSSLQEIAETYAIHGDEDAIRNYVENRTYMCEVNDHCFVLQQF